ncbi:MAG: hypothetical protein Q7S37_01210 [bacterium]|nr:hypothetical protein [bacterium]
MKIKSLKYVLGELVFYIIFWLVGVGLFWGLILLCQEKFHYSVDWQLALIWSIVPGYIWFIIGTLLTWKDDKIAEGRKAITDAVAKLFREKPL